MLDQLTPSLWKTVDEKDLLKAIAKIEVHLESVDQALF